MSVKVLKAAEKEASRDRIRVDVDVGALQPHLCFAAYRQK